MSTPSSNFPLRPLQTLGLTTASIATGVSLSYTVLIVPRLLESPTSLMLKQWYAAYNQGKILVPSLAALGSSSFLILSWFTYYHPPVLTHTLKSQSALNVWKPYLIAGVLAISLVPYTLLVMKETNGKLLTKVEETKELKVEDQVVEIGLKKGESAKELVDLWGTLNLGRTALLLAGTGVGIWTALA